MAFTSAAAGTKPRKPRYPKQIRQLFREENFNLPFEMDDIYANGDIDEVYLFRTCGGGKEQVWVSLFKSGGLPFLLLSMNEISNNFRELLPMPLCTIQPPTTTNDDDDYKIDEDAYISQNDPSLINGGTVAPQWAIETMYGIEKEVNRLCNKEIVLKEFPKEFLSHKMICINAEREYDLATFVRDEVIRQNRATMTLKRASILCSGVERSLMFFKESDSFPGRVVNLFHRTLCVIEGTPEVDEHWVLCTGPHSAGYAFILFEFYETATSN